MNTPLHDPLKIHLTRPIRVSIMLSLFVAFFVTSPLIILYTQGWRWNFATWKIESTGAISIDTKPVDAQVYVNDQLIQTAQPIRLTSLAPGIYRIKITKDGFHPFTTNVTVRSQETTYIRNTTLFKVNEPQLLSAQNHPPQQITLISGKPLTYFTLNTEQKKQTLGYTSGATSTISEIFSLCSLTRPYCVAWNPGEKTARIISTVDPTEEHKLTLADIKSWQWNEEKRGPLAYVQSGSQLVSVNTNFKTQILQPTSSTIWFVDSNQELWNYANKTFSLPAEQKSVAITGPDDVQTIISVTDHYALLRGKQGMYVISEPRTSATVSYLPDYQNAAYHTATEEWRLWSPWEISSVYAATGNKAILYRSGEKIKQIEPLEPAGVLLVVTDTTLRALNPGYYSSQDLATFTSIQDVSVDEVNRLILVSGEYHGTQGIFSLEY